MGEKKDMAIERKNNNIIYENWRCNIGPFIEYTGSVFKCLKYINE